MWLRGFLQLVMFAAFIVAAVMVVRIARDPKIRRRTDRGASAVEYGLIVAAVGVTFLAALQLMGIFKETFASGACDETRGYTCCAEDDPAYAANCPTPAPSLPPSPAPTP